MQRVAIRVQRLSVRALSPRISVSKCETTALSLGPFQQPAPLLMLKLPIDFLCGPFALLPWLETKEPRGPGRVGR